VDAYSVIHLLCPQSLDFSPGERSRSEELLKGCFRDNEHGTGTPISL